MQESNNKDNQPKWLKEIFSVKGLLVGVILLMGYWIFFDNSKETTDFSNLVGVGQAINSETAKQLNVDLSQYLDPQIVPAIVEESLKNVAQSGATEDAFVQGFVNEVSARLQSVSTIDLNADGIADPLLVIPKQVAEGGEHMTLSIRVPDFSEVKTLPEGTDQQAWQDIADNKSLEIMTASAVKSQADQMTVQAAANPQTYPSHPPYYSSSFGSVFMTAMMVNWMMTPRVYPMYGGYGAPPRQVSDVQRNRASNSSQYNRSTGTSNAARTASGQSIASNKFSKIKPTAMNQVRSSEFRKRSQSSVRSGGFGRSVQKPQVRQSRRSTAPRRSFGRRRR